MKNATPLWSLLLLVPAPSIGTYCAMVLFPDTIIGQSIFVFCKIWLLGLPLFWWLYVNKKKLPIKRPSSKGLAIGAATGLGISLIISAVYFFGGEALIDKEGLTAQMTKVGLASLPLYLCTATYWILVNSLLEEYVWRWFVVKQTEKLLPQKAAIFTSAGLFTLHHIVAMQIYFDWLTTALCSLGVFIGGLTWSYLYSKYRTVWPAYLSHAIIDLTIFAIGGHLIFL